MCMLRLYVNGKKEEARGIYLENQSKEGEMEMLDKSAGLVRFLVSLMMFVGMMLTVLGMALLTLITLVNNESPSNLAM
ncbi:hypothetical protein NDU88_001999 [Pleurodeles waltl]|uniref:Uncharacterized protein n=1 Tax=Pleurodeles waltl TaxID=8319 RepID=A0AAV7LEE5_PLEWA|nr:hypothetical protein NDU88_001999 [Pleurodeles waltl]